MAILGAACETANGLFGWHKQFVRVIGCWQEPSTAETNAFVSMTARR